jgi:predicted transcriptional regulator
MPCEVAHILMSWVLKKAVLGNTHSSVQTLTLKLSTDTAARLERMATRRRITKSAVMREALEEKLRAAANEPSVYDLMKASIGSIDSGIGDLGHNPVHLKGFGQK